MRLFVLARAATVPRGIADKDHDQRGHADAVDREKPDWINHLTPPQMNRVNRGPIGVQYGKKLKNRKLHKPYIKLVGG